nr:MAG TPA: DNA polymerase III, alpha subunit [Caudoviricetes sp.]
MDIDLAPSKLQKIFSAIREERGELGLIQVCTFGTEGTKSTILTACRGYRSEEYPNGIDNDEALYISSLVPVERGFLWSLKDLTEGNEEKGRKPSKIFINTVQQYPGLLKIMKGIESLVCRRGSHASGVIFFDENIYDDAAIMRTPSGALVTQWDLHMQEAAGSVKYDFLLTSVQDIIIQTINLLQEDNVIEKDLTLRQVYNKYLHPSVLPRDDKKMWDALANGSVVNCFQFDSSVGAQAAKRIKPRTPLEMSDANGLMRLMTSEEGGENPIDKYVRFKNNIQLWYKEMREAGLTIEEQKILEPYFLQSYGVPPSQEQMMMMLQDENICGFSLAEANTARKIVGKKQMDKIPDLHKKVLMQAKSENLGKYVWACGIGPQMGYSFSLIHALAYSFVGMQTLYLATHFNPIYWNTACLIVNSGALLEDDSTDYAKVAKAIGSIRSAGIKVSLADINNSGFGFKPDVANN